MSPVSKPAVEAVNETARSHGCRHELVENRVSRVLEGNLYLLEDGLEVRRAAGCVLDAEAGDRVLVARAVDAGVMETGYIVQILAFANARKDAVNLVVPDCRKVAWQQDEIAVTTANRLSLSSVNEVEIMSLRRAVEIKARQLLTCITNSIVETAKEKISTTEFTQMKSSVLTHIQTKQAIITADEDIRIDGERINLG